MINLEINGGRKLSTQELAVKEVLGYFNERRPAVGADEGVFAFKQLFALIIGLGGVEFVSGSDGSFAGTAGQGVVVHASGFPVCQQVTHDN